MAVLEHYQRHKTEAALEAVRVGIEAAFGSDGEPRPVDTTPPGQMVKRKPGPKPKARHSTEESNHAE